MIRWAANLVRRLLGWPSPSLLLVTGNDAIVIPGWVWYAIYLAACAAFAWEVSR